MILALAGPEDDLVRDVLALAANRGLEVLRWDEPESPRLCWELPAPAPPAYCAIGDRQVPITALSGVLVRALPAAPLSYGTETDDEYLSKEWLAALLGFLRAMPCPVINRPRPLRSFRQPLLPAWAAEIAAAGLRLPDMLVTGSPEDAAEFRARHAGRVLTVMPPGRFAAEHDARPACLLATPTGLCRHVFVAGAEVYATPAEAGLPDSLAARCRRAARRLGLEFAEFQVVSDDAGDTAMAVSDFPDTSACPPEVRERMARALLDVLAGARREVLA